MVHVVLSHHWFFVHLSWKCRGLFVLFALWFGNVDVEDPELSKILSFNLEFLLNIAQHTLPVAGNSVSLIVISINLIFSKSFLHFLPAYQVYKGVSCLSLGKMGCPAYHQKQLMQVSMLRACEYKQASNNNDFDCFFFFLTLDYLFISTWQTCLKMLLTTWILMVNTLKYEGWHHEFIVDYFDLVALICCYNLCPVVILSDWWDTKIQFTNWLDRYI